MIVANPKLSEESQKKLHDTINDLDLMTGAEKKFKDANKQQQFGSYTPWEGGAPSMSGFGSAAAFDGAEQVDAETVRIKYDDLLDGPLPSN